MVVSDVGGLPEIVEDGKSGYVVEAKPESIAHAIQKYFDEGKADSFQKGTKELKERFSWNRLAEGFLELVNLNNER